MQVSPKALGLTFGTIEGLALFLFALTASSSGYALEFVELVGTLFPSYEATTQGAFAGLIWGFVDGLIGGALIAWLYNKFSSCACCK